MRTPSRIALGLAFAAALTLSAPLCGQAPQFQNLHSFDVPPPANPRSTLIADVSGNLLGTTSSGGAFGFGTVFELDAAHGYALRVLHAFQGPDGNGPMAGLIADSAGFLYGTTFGGGTAGAGTVFRLDPSSGYALTTLHSFAAPEGSGPTAAVLLDGSGNLYGTTQGGGAHAHGTAFVLDAANGYALTTLHSFAGADGAEPMGALILDPAGNLYGTTSAGGTSPVGYGTVFFLDASSGYALTTLHLFQGTDGRDPEAALTIDPAGNLYGTTAGGTVFQLDASNAYALTTLHTFQVYDGSRPVSSLIRDAAGNLWGTTSFGGIFGLYGYGTVFRLDAGNAFALTTLHSFNYEDGAFPEAALLTDASGNLYGATAEGGVGGGAPGYYGTVFRLDAASDYALTTLVHFGITDGARPQGSLIADGSDNLYGTTSEGGAYGFGSVYRLDASSHALTTLHSFVDTDGFLPRAALLMDGSGNLYGTTGGGGAIGSEYGTVFKLDASNGYALTTLFNFNHADGSGPVGALIMDAAGNLFGTTNDGGPGGTFASGTVFELDASNGYAMTTLHAFAFADGAYPSSALILDSAGNLYGTTASGGASMYYGTVFKLDASNGYALTTLHDFDGVDGSEPVGALIVDADGNLYGTTFGNGVSDYGTVFELDASSGYALTTLHRFAESDGAYPYAALLADAAGNLFGTTVGGGASLKGTVFELDGSNGYALTTLHEFAVMDGASPAASLFADAGGNLYGTAQDGGAGGTGVVFRIGPAIPLTLGGIEPSSGPAAGFAPVLAHGTGFLPGSSLLIGGVETLEITVVDQGRIGAKTPALTPGTLNDVTVAGPGNASLVMLSGAFFADFTDVAQGALFHGDIETIFRAGITAGCGGGNYCPSLPVSRQQMAVFLLKAEHGAAYVPPDCQSLFDDVPCPGLFANWIEQLASEGITAGCGGNDFCPASPVTRQQMAVFLLKTEHGSAYVPPTCTGVFDDVPCPGTFADWIEQLHAEQVTGGCQVSPPLYCPASPVNRAQMATFLVKTFSLP